MEIIVSDTYAELSKHAADVFIDAVRRTRHPLICTASGDSPAGLYKEMVSRYDDKQVDVSSWYFVGLDEWAGMNGDDEGSCRFHLNNQFFHPLGIAEDKICFFDGRMNLEGECERTELFIRDHDGIDLAIVGLGMNGHVGMNEPGTSPALRSHITEIDPTTQQVGQKYFSSERKLSHGVTLGIATLMDARHIMLIVSGTHKAEIVRRVMEDKISEYLPATFLRNHSQLTVFLDAPAAKLMSNR